MYVCVRVLQHPLIPQNLLCQDKQFGRLAGQVVAEPHPLDSSWNFAMCTVAVSEGKACPTPLCRQLRPVPARPVLKTGLSYKDKGGLSKLKAIDPVEAQKVLEPGTGRSQDHLSFPSLLFSLHHLHSFCLCFLGLGYTRSQSRWKFPYLHLHTKDSGPPQPSHLQSWAGSHLIRWLLGPFPSPNSHYP